MEDSIKILLNDTSSISLEYSELYSIIPDNPYLLLTPGPISTSKSVRAAMLFDLCTWDDDYKDLTQNIRRKLIKLATDKTEKYTAILMQGSGTFTVESVLGSVISSEKKLLILSNGAYGRRMEEIAKRLSLNYIVNNTVENMPVDIELMKKTLGTNPDITHIAFVHCETTTGLLNPINEVTSIAGQYGIKIIVDAMSSFGGIPIDVNDYGIDFLISSANKCIEGVPGFGFVIADLVELRKTRGVSHSLSLDLYDQWEEMDKSGKWRFTSPTHTVRAFYQAITELEEEGGIQARNERYKNIQEYLVEGMEDMGFKCLLPRKMQSPIITAFLYPESPIFSFYIFYKELKKNGFVIYPGKISQQETFRIGNIGCVSEKDVDRLLNIIKVIKFW